MGSIFSVEEYAKQETINRQVASILLSTHWSAMCYNTFQGKGKIIPVLS
jgi:hypothetical protein